MLGGEVGQTNPISSSLILPNKVASYLVKSHQLGPEYQYEQYEIYDYADYGAEWDYLEVRSLSSFKDTALEKIYY